MTCKTLHQIIKDNDVELFEEYLKNSSNIPLEFEYEDLIITGHHKELLMLLIQYKPISSDALSLSSMFDDDVKIINKMKTL